MGTPARRYSTDIGALTRDTSGLLWLVHQHVGRTGEALDYLVELVMLSVYSAGGVITAAATLDLTGTVVTVTGPHFGVTKDARTPVVFDGAGDGVTLDLAAFDAFADGTHTVVVRATPVTTNVTFDTPARVVRDTSGNVISTVASESITHAMTSTLGVLTLVDGTAIADADVPVATVAKTGSSWASLTATGSAPTRRT